MLNDLKKARRRVPAPVVDVTDDNGVRTAYTRPLQHNPPTGTLADIPFDNARDAPRDIVIKRKIGDEWRDVTATQFRDEVVATAKGLIARGVTPGARVALMARTSYEWALLDLAIWTVGGVVVPIYPTSSTEQARWILTDSAAYACLTESAQHTKVIADTGVHLPTWELADGAIAQLGADGREIYDDVTNRRKAITPDTEATLIYTSGTTGMPKGCSITHGSILTSIDSVNDLLLPPYQAMHDEPPSTLLFLPLAHVLGRQVHLACLRARVLIGYWPTIQPADVRPELAKFRPTFLVGVPYLWEKIRDNARAEAQDMGKAGAFDRSMKIAARYGRLAAEVDSRESISRPGLVGLRLAHGLYDLLVYRRIRAALGGRITYGISGGSALMPELAHCFTGAGIAIYSGYGLTESFAAITVNHPLHPRPSTVGAPVPGAHVRVAESREILLRGPMIFSGYQGRDDATDASIDSEGWYHTGDLGEIDDAGYLTITGRAKEIIVTSGGKNVSPVLLEDRLRSHPLVSQCMVIGDDRPFIAALITLDPVAVEQWRKHASDTSDTALRDAVQEGVDDANTLVSRAESIREFRIVDEDFTEENGLLTPSLKLRRSLVAAKYADDVAALYP